MSGARCSFDFFIGCNDEQTLPHVKNRLFCDACLIFTTLQPVRRHLTARRGAKTSRNAPGACAR